MLIYNTTFHVEEELDRTFLIWMRECYIPEVEKQGLLRSPRLARVLSHREDGGISYALQWEVDDSATLHRWHVGQGVKLQEEMEGVFKDKVVGFPTLMEVVE